MVFRVSFVQTYEEHAAILEATLAGDTPRAVALLHAHIQGSQAAVRKITLHRLYSARGARAA